VFLLVGVVLAAALAVGLFSTVGGPSAPSLPRAGSPAPGFSLPAVAGGGRVGTPATGDAGGRPEVLLFFGNWCAVCHTDTPPLATAVRAQQQAGGPLARIRVIGVDSYDSRGAARSFAADSGVTFPVALDSVAKVTNGLYDFTGDPETVFVDARGTITAVKYGPLSPTAFLSLERKLVATG
jgi:peroxiredoxin